MVCYRTTSPRQQRDLAAAVAELADDTGFPLLIDLRAGLVGIDSGKDQWDDDAHGLDLDFNDLAGNIQTAAGLGAADGAAALRSALPRRRRRRRMRAFWVAALGYTHDRRAGLTDIHDPRRLNPVLVFREFDARESKDSASSATASTSSSWCPRILRRRASPRSSQLVAVSSTSRRIAGGSTTPKATNL